jgi:hypothetical protein
LTAEVERFLQPGALSQYFAGTFLVGIKAGFSNLLLEFSELLLFRINVKETSALPRCAF